MLLSHDLSHDDDTPHGDHDLPATCRVPPATCRVPDFGCCSRSALPPLMTLLAAWLPSLPSLQLGGLASSEEPHQPRALVLAAASDSAVAANGPSASAAATGRGSAKHGGSLRG